MPNRVKPTPEKYCEHCKAKLERKIEPDGDREAIVHFMRRKYCNQRCMAAGFTGRRVANPRKRTAHMHARKICPPGPCVDCGAEKYDVHHRDENPFNNSPENLERRCRSCHMKHHRPSEHCRLEGCTNTVSSATDSGGNGLCSMHWQRERRWGDPLVVKANQHTEPVRQVGPLKVGRPRR